MSPTATYRDHLPQLDAPVFLTDGGCETTLVFHDGFDLPDFAAFPLLRDPAGRAALDRYLDGYAAVAARDGVGIVLETATWRASADWGARLGYDAAALDAANRDAVDQVLDARRRHETPTTPVVVSGNIGPRGDGYVVGQAMSADEARTYHAAQVRTFATTAADLVTAMTMNYVEEAIGIVQAAAEAEMPVVIAFTVETDGLLPSGQALGEAIQAVDAATDGYVSYFMVNCAHPTHFAHLFEDGPAWAARIGGVRANASKMSHAELDEATELDPGDPDELAEDYLVLRRLLPELRVLGGCCGTDHGHVGAISAACAVPAA
jgi:S-methylmethionine-dependent homocysteine/selenocysteine methylase